MMTTVIVGAGNMGSAVYQGITASSKATDVHLCDHSESNLTIAPEHCRFTDVMQATEDIECVVLAVKPQSFTALMKDLGDSLSDKLVISIMAGISTSQLEDLTGSSRIVRSMPNLGAKIGRSVTGWSASGDVSETDRDHIKLLFSAIGMSVELSSEELIDPFSVIAGSGPAYVFGLAELLQANAETTLALSAKEASKIASEVIAAGSHLLDEGSKTAAEWRKAVTSKAGITEAVITSLTDKNIQKTFDDALAAGTLRSKSLSKDHD